MNKHNWLLRISTSILALVVVLSAKGQVYFPTQVRLIRDSIAFIGNGESGTNTIVLVLRNDQTFQYRTQGTSCFLSGSSIGRWTMIGDTLTLQRTEPEADTSKRFFTTDQKGDSIDLAALPQLDPAPCTNTFEIGVLIKFAWLEKRLLPVRCSRPQDGNWVFAEHYPVLELFDVTSDPIFSSKKH